MLELHVYACIMFQSSYDLLSDDLHVYIYVSFTDSNTTGKGFLKIPPIQYEVTHCSGGSRGVKGCKCTPLCIVAKCPGLVGTVPEFAPMSRLCPGLPDFAALSRNPARLHKWRCSVHVYISMFSWVWQYIITGKWVWSPKRGSGP